MLSAGLALAVAVLPGLLTWFWGRSLVRAVDDPTLPERVLAWRNRSAAAFAAGAAILVVLLPRHAAWGLGVLILVRLAGGFPARRALFDERWDFVAYLAHVARLIVGVAGFWLVLVLAPALVSWARPHLWPAGVALALVLVAWGLTYSGVLLRVTGATRLARPELEARFAEIAERSTAPMPRVWVAGHPEGRMANALALPHTRTPSVVFTRTLVEAFDTDELGAVFAHEQAHLEHFNPRRLKRLAVLQTIAVLLGTLGSAAVLDRFGARGALVILGWPILVMVVALLRLVRHRAHEAESDRRAVELCGDPGALARALVKLHALALLPRRLSVELENRATHPSLATRLRAIEQLAGEGPATPIVAAARGDGASAAEAPAGLLPAAVEGAESGAWVLLDPQQAHWLEGVPEGTPGEPEELRAAALRTRSLAYSELVELRLQPRGREHALLASDRAGATWSLRLAPGEVAAAHEALNAVDQRLAPSSAARPERRLLGAIVACAGAIVALVAWSATLLPALLATVLPHPGPLAAFGAAALTSVALSLLSGAPTAMFDPELAPLAHLGLAVCGAAALWIAGTTAWREGAGRTRTAPWVALFLALSGLAVLSLPLIAFVSGGALRAHVAARDHPGGAILLIAAAAALLVVPRRWARVVAAATGVVAGLALGLGTQAFADRFVQDPFFAPGQGASPSDPLLLELVDEQALPAASGQLELSPSGKSWAIRQFEVGEGGAPPVHRMIVGSASGPEHAYPVTDLRVMSDTRLLALLQDGDRPTLELRPHDPAAPAEWSVGLEPLLEGAELAADPSTGAWRVSGTHTESGAFVRTTGRLDGTFTIDRFHPGDNGAAWVAGDGPAVLGVAAQLGDLGNEYLDGDVEDDPPALWWLMAGAVGGFGSRVLSLGADGTRELYESQMFLQCDAAPPGHARPLCRANDGSRTVLWRIDPADGRREAVASLEGFVWPARALSSGWLLTVNLGTKQHVYRLEGDSLQRLDVGDTPPWILAVAGYEDGVGVLVSDKDGKLLLRRYAVP